MGRHCLSNYLRHKLIKNQYHTVHYIGQHWSLDKLVAERIWHTALVTLAFSYIGYICILVSALEQMQFMLLFSRQGKLRLQKWYVAHPDKLKKKITRELVTAVLARKPKMCSFIEWKDLKIVYKR